MHLFSPSRSLPSQATQRRPQQGRPSRYLRRHTQHPDTLTHLIQRTLSIAGRLSPGQFHHLGRRLGDLWYCLDSHHRRIAAANLRLAFGRERLAKERCWIARETFRNLALIPLELGWSLGRPPADSLARIHVRGHAHLEEALQSGKGALILTAHTGNWEILTVAAGTLDTIVNIVYRPLDNVSLDRFMYGFRGRFGACLIPRAGSLRAMIRALRRGESVALLMDQNVGWRKGVFVDFFGYPACTHKVMALLALKTGAPVVPLFICRQGHRFRVEFHPALATETTGDPAMDLEHNTRRYNEVIENWIRRHPTQWLWLHRRWKTRPKIRK